MKIEQDISLVVWLGCLALLFLAVAVHEGWIGGSKAAPIVTSGTENAANPSGPVSIDANTSTNVDYGNMPWWYVPWVGDVMGG